MLFPLPNIAGIKNYTGNGGAFVWRNALKQLLEEKVSPLLARHYGGAELTALENNVAKVRMTGACGGCPSAQYTIEDVVKQILMESPSRAEGVI